MGASARRQHLSTCEGLLCLLWLQAWSRKDRALGTRIPLQGLWAPTCYRESPAEGCSQVHVWPQHLQLQVTGISMSLLTYSSTFLKLKTFADWKISFPQALGPGATLALRAVPSVDWTGLPPVFPTGCSCTDAHILPSSLPAASLRAQRGVPLSTGLTVP